MINKLSMKNTVLLIFLITCSMHRIKGNQLLNLTKITWTHGTNTQKQLKEALDSNVNFIEADIVYGYIKDDNEKLTRQPVMAHPPDEESDITLKEFLSQIWDFNDKVSKSKQKAVKLDFKTTDVFRSSLLILNEMWNFNYEIWLNADIFSGPVNNTFTQPVDADFFLSESKKFGNATLSTGWTTKWGADFSAGFYDYHHVLNMINGIRRNEINNALTFPIRAGIAAQSEETLKYLYDTLKINNYVTFTIWSSNGDYVDVDKLRKFIFNLGLDKIYIDVPNELLTRLRLDIEPKYDSNH